MKTYIIFCATDAYHSARSAKSLGRQILEWEGTTPIKWVHDDNCGHGYTLAEARKVLHGYYKSDKAEGNETETHKYMDSYYHNDVWTYGIEPVELQISSVKTYRTNATIFLNDGSNVSISYDFQDANAFDNEGEIEQWLEGEIAEAERHFDKKILRDRAKLLDIYNVVYNAYCSNQCDL